MSGGRSEAGSNEVIKAQPVRKARGASKATPASASQTWRPARVQARDSVHRLSNVVSCHAVEMLLHCVSDGHHAVASTCLVVRRPLQPLRGNRPSRHTIPTALHSRYAPSGSMNAAAGMRHDRPGLRDLDPSGNARNAALASSQDMDGFPTREFSIK